MKLRLPLLILILLFSTSLNAQSPLNMVFIYPGGEGSSEDAQPILNEFFASIKNNGGPQITGKYFPDISEGIRSIKNLPAHIGIVSLDLYLEKKKQLPMEILLATQPIQSKSGTDSYYLVVNKESSASEGSLPSTLHISRPLSDHFISKVIMNNLSVGALPQVKTVNHILSELKKLGNGNLNAGALLDAFQYEGLQKLKLPWAKNLKVIYASPKIPSSPLVAFKRLSDETRQKLTEALDQMSKSKEGKEILESLRLKGFVKPELEKYELLLKVL